MITNKGQLVDKIYKWLIRDASTDKFVTPDMVETYIQLTEAEFSRELKIVDLIETASLNAVNTDGFISLPSDFRGIVSLEFNSRPFDIEWFATRRDMKEKYNDNSGRPRGYIIQGGKIIFSNTPDQSYSMTMDYYKSVPPLTEANPTNIILEKFPDAYLYGGIRQALLNLNIKDRLADNATIYKDIIDRIKEDDKNLRFPVGGVMKPATVFGG